MKVLYITMALVLSCVVPTYSMSMQELQNTSHYEMLHGFGESGNGDGTYIDKDSIKASNGPNGTKQITITQYVLMPAGDTIQEKQVLYTFNTKQSFANLIKKLDAHQLASYKDLWLSKQVDFGFAGYLLANRLYERVYGMQFDDVVVK